MGRSMTNSNLRLTVIDIAGPLETDTLLLNNCYELWKEVYEPIHKEANQTLETEHFYRAKFLVVLHDENKVPTAFSMHNVLNMELLDIQNVHYFSGANTLFMHKIKEEKHKVMTVEWVTVRPQDRVRFSKLQYYDLIMALNTKAFQLTGCTAAMGFSRMDLKIDRMVERFGYRGCGEIDRLNIVCQIMLLTKSDIKAHPFKIVEQTANELWASRNIQSVYINNKGTQYERAS